jgi:hypothetical protein
MLEPNMAQMVAISLHELATKAAKYGSLSAADGRVEIAWSCTADGRLDLRWTESGSPSNSRDRDQPQDRESDIYRVLFRYLAARMWPIGSQPTFGDDSLDDSLNVRFRTVMR